MHIGLGLCGEKDWATGGEARSAPIGSEAVRQEEGAEIDSEAGKNVPCFQRLEGGVGVAGASYASGDVAR